MIYDFMMGGDRDGDGALLRPGFGAFVKGDIELNQNGMEKLHGSWSWSLGVGG